MKEELISVVMPAYNSEKYIKYCLESICSQSYKNIEIIVVSDGSTDKTEEIVMQLQKDDDRIILITQENSGASIARNNGIKHSKGEYILFFDSDDILKENALQIMYNEIKKEKADLVMGSLEIKENDKQKQVVGRIEEKVYQNNDVFKCSVMSPYPGTKLYNNNIIKKNNIKFANVKVGQDLNFFLKYLLYSTKIKVVTDIFAEYRIVSNGISRTYSYKILDIVNSFEDIKKNYLKEEKGDIYNYYISIAEAIHYGYQISKIKFIKNKIDRKIMMLYFNRYFKSITLQWNDFTKSYKKNYFKIKIKLLFRKIYVSNLYCKRS